MNKVSAFRVASDLKQLSIGLIKIKLLETENWKLIGQLKDQVHEIRHNTTDYSDNGSELDAFKINDCFYKHTKEYHLCSRTGDFAFKLLDGSLIQISYLFKNNQLIKQKMTYFQKPYSDAELSFLTDDEDFNASDSSLDNLGLVWLRFDFDPSKGVELFHPNTHLTISNFKNCRIPVSSPMTSAQFINMIIINFYEEKYYDFNKQMKKSKLMEKQYSETFFQKEKSTFRVHAY